MPKVVPVRLMPTSPTEADEFAKFVEDLIITAWDASIDNPLATTKIGEAKRLPFTNTANDPPTDNPNNRIYLHRGNLGSVPSTPQAIATAVIELPAGSDPNPDLRLEIDRGGKVIMQMPVQFSCATDDVDLAKHAEYAQLISDLYLFLPPPGNDEELEVHAKVLSATSPLEESGWTFSELQIRADAVIAEEVDLAAAGKTPRDWLAGVEPDTPEGSAALLHVAGSLAAKRNAFPSPARPLSDLYTLEVGAQKQNDELAAARQSFELALDKVESKRQASSDAALKALKALRYAYVFHDRSAKTLKTNDDDVGWHVPLFEPAKPGKIAEVAINLKKS